MPSRGSPNGTLHTPPQPVHSPIARSRSPGTGGRHRLERLVVINRNRWSPSPGARTWGPGGCFELAHASFQCFDVRRLLLVAVHLCAVP
jgi:hypothetical protein